MTTENPSIPSPLPPSRPVLWAVLSIALIVLAVLVYAPILYYMGIHWSQVDDASHGFVVAPLALYFAWERRSELRRVALVPSWWGLVPLVLGSLTLVVGRLGVELMNMRVSFVLTLCGLVLLVMGRQVFRVLAFPLCFLFLMIPLPQSLVNVIAFPLQLMAAQGAVYILYLLQIPALLEGNIIHLPDTTLFVAQACSGLRSLMALITLGVVFAYFFRKSWAERIVIVASAIPIAILVNALRVTVTGILSYQLGEMAAGGAIHEFQGLITFGAAFVLLLAEAWLLARIWPESWRGSARRRARATT